MTTEARESTSSSSRSHVHLHRHARPRREYYIAAVLFSLALIAGVVIGVGGTIVYMKNKNFRRPPSAENFGRGIMERMNTLVTLTGDESEKLEAIVISRMKEMDRIRKDSFGDIREIFHAMSDEMKEVLGPERFKIWDEDFRSRFGRKNRPDDDRDKRRDRGEGGDKDERKGPGAKG